MAERYNPYDNFLSVLDKAAKAVGMKEEDCMDPTDCSRL